MHRGENMNVWILDDAVVYDYYKVTDYDSSRINMGSYEDPYDYFLSDSLLVEGQAVRIEFVNEKGGRRTNSSGNKRVMRSRVSTGGKYHYFKGEDSTGWIRNVGRFAEVYDEEIYEGISARYYFDNGQMRYDIVVQPGADPSTIRMKISGANNIRINESGELELDSDIGKIKHKDLKTYERKNSRNKKNNRGRSIKSAFKVDKEGLVVFEIGKYDSTKTLVIDPLIVSSYVGGVNNEVCIGSVVDQFGFVYVVGSTESPVFPSTTGSYSNSHTASNGDEDVFIYKLHPNGDELDWAATFGGNSNDRAYGVALPSGEFGGNTVVLTGLAGSGFPQYNATQGSYGGGTRDAFVVRLDTDGSTLRFATYIGGSSSDRGLAIEWDASSTRMILAGDTQSSNLPVTAGVYQGTLGGGSDVFLSAFDFAHVTTNTLSYTTYIGGTGNDRPYAVKFGSKGPVVCGFSLSSANFPTTPTAVSQTHSGSRDAFLTELDQNCQNVLYSTFVGTSGDDRALGLEVNTQQATSNIFTIVGQTTSSAFPTTTTAHRTSFSDAQDGFVCRISSNNQVLFSTFVGGDGVDAATSIRRTILGDLLVVGQTHSTNLSISGDVLQSTNEGGMDIMIARYSDQLNNLNWCTYLGGSNDDNVQAVVIDSFNRIILVGSTDSDDFDTTPGAHDTQLN